MTEENRCRKICIFNTLLTQAYTRRTLYSNIVNGLNSLIALQNLIGGREMPGWGLLSEQLTKSTIEKNTIAYIKSNDDVKTIKETLKNGCATCRILLSENVLFEEMIAEQSEEAVLNFIMEEPKNTQWLQIAKNYPQIAKTYPKNIKEV